MRPPGQQCYSIDAGDDDSSDGAGSGRCYRPGSVG